ncbi:transcriptional regulator [Actinomadura craniellae]|uniref:Transcriptional regulator n=1 Tax=Actinomadura craniellae TaxID=2231787 RepID=A0A365H7U8_9ACTN|nr:helix-turn-helix transcriptional regulator [Actinomadura craniellae]RAY15194.1 transcriptional regulator [Actinomadura craniellae]
MAKQTRPPTARLRRLAGELLALRQHAGLSRDDVNERSGINPATLYRIEVARSRPQARTLKTLLDLYEVDQDRRDALTLLFRESGQRNWLLSYPADLPERYSTYISFESEAHTSLTFGATLVPGLLQTEDYARAVIRGLLPEITSEEVEQRVEARMRRQTILDRENPLRLWAIVDEAALRRQVGSPQAMNAQIAHLRESMDRPEVTLQVLPFEAGPHPAMLGEFIILKFEGAIAPDIVYIDGLAGDLFVDDAPSIARYIRAFEHLRAIASSPAATHKILATLARDA